MTFKKIEIPSENEILSTEQNANAYKFKIEMIVTLFAENELQASEQVDANGGFVVSRNVKLLEAIEIHKAKADEKE